MKTYNYQSLNSRDIESLYHENPLEKINLEINCIKCNKTYNVQVFPQDLIEFCTDSSRNIALIFNYLSADERELLISRICGPCFDKIFPDED